MDYLIADMTTGAWNDAQSVRFQIGIAIVIEPDRGFPCWTNERDRREMERKLARDQFDEALDPIRKDRHRAYIQHLEDRQRAIE
jgi:hypothetical protein